MKKGKGYTSCVFFCTLGTPRRGYSIASSSAASDISKSSRKDWAKIRVALKQENKQESEAIQKSKTANLS